MDSIISFDKVVGFLRNPPTVVPRADFSKLRALRQHIVKALKQIDYPQCFIHGWLGLTMAPAVYALLKPQPFVMPADPGPGPVYVLITVCAQFCYAYRDPILHPDMRFSAIFSNF
jgi:hypothetical protein